MDWPKPTTYLLFIAGQQGREVREAIGADYDQNVMTTALQWVETSWIWQGNLK